MTAMHRTGSGRSRKLIEPRFALSLVALVLLFPLTDCGSLEMTDEQSQSVTVVQVVESAQRNEFYVSNRSPLLDSPLIKLPIGAITPRGWLRTQLELMADGQIGRLAEISEFCRTEDNSWLSADGEGHSPWEEVPYWLKGFGDLGYILGDQRIIGEARLWIDGILGSQEEDGWFGPRRNKEKHDCWPNMVALNCLQSYHEATGDERVLPFMTRYFRWQLDVPREHLLPGSWQKIRGGDNLESIYWLYNRTGDAFLLDLARVMHERTADWTAGIANWHGVNICQGFREPGIYYQQAKDSAFINSALRNYHEVMHRFGQVPGGMFGADENCREGYSGPRQAAETCSMVEFMHSFEMLLKITGDGEWADRCEDVAFNSLPAALTADHKALHYLTAPNMVQLDAANKSPGLQNRGCMLAFSPHRYRCCQHNVSHGWPYYAEELWLATRGNGLCASLYAASEVDARVGRDGRRVRIVEETDYPFGESIRFTIVFPGEERPRAARTRFPLYLRVPRWCAAARVEVNGLVVSAMPEPISYVKIDRAWKDGDQVDLLLPMEIEVKEWERQYGTVSVSAGPLAFALAIGEKWIKAEGKEEWQNHEKADLESSAEWPAHEVFPTTPWNFGLVVDHRSPAASFEMVRKSGPLAAQPFTFEDAPVSLRARARPIPAWKMEDGLVGRMQQGPIRSDEPEESVILVPMGCAKLRIASFPKIDNGPMGRDWIVAPEPRASHCFASDTTRALNDGLSPESSKDSRIARFTWWDHKGSVEWVAYDFDAPRAVSAVEVYWFDDRGIGHCRVPASWRIFWLDDETWKPVANKTPYETATDRYNRVEFERVVTRGLKIEVQLEEDYSGGILEWRVE